MTEEQLKGFEERMRDLVSVSERLIKILFEENKALAVYDSEGVRTNFEEKDRLCRAYEILVKRMVEKKEFTTEVDEDLREELKSIGEELEELMAENARLLTIAINSGKRFMDRVSNSVKQGSVKAPTYTNDGVVSGTQPGGSVAVTYNRNY